MLLEGEEKVSAFPTDLKRAPEHSNGNSDREDRGDRSQARPPQQNQEGAGNDPPSDPSDGEGSGDSSGYGSSKGKSSKKINKKKKKSVKKSDRSKAPALRNLPDPGAASAEAITDQKRLKEEILKECRNPLAREVYAKTIDGLPLNELKLTIDSIKERQKYFAGKELPSVYRAKAKDLLARYFSLYSVEGFDDRVAVDDCEVAHFAEAIIGADSPVPTSNTSTASVSKHNRPDPPIVLNS